MKKSIMAMVLTTVIMVSLLGAFIEIGYGGLNTDPASWYMTVPGVLNSDYYLLYPFDTTKNLTIGMSKFGELIDGKTGVGLRYGNTTNFIDPFASGPYVPEFEWNQGWVIDITYSYESEYRRIWAFALYSDSYKSPDSIGGDWKFASAPESTTVLGGRKYGGYRYNGTNYIPMGYASTQPFTVLYNGPRLFVGLSNNTIWEDPTTPLVRVLLTFIFEKDKKYVTVLKDIKLLDTRKGTGTLQVEFSNRGEWDLGQATAPISYAHFFDDQYTSMHEGWQPFYNTSDGHPAYYDVAQIISITPSGYVGFAAFWPSLTSKYVEAFASTSRKQRLSTMETWKAAFTATASQTVFTLTPPANPLPIMYPRGAGIWSDVPMVFVNGELRPESGAANGWAWSNHNTVTFNTGLAAGDLVWIVYKQYVHQTDMSAPGVPYVIGEWDFDLKHSLDPTTTQFRGVTVYGIVDNHDASDNPSAPVLDREAKYQLDEVFNPWDLYSAVEKQTQRWVEFTYGPTWTSSHSVVLNVPTSMWDQYGVFSERVIDLDTGYLLNRYNGDYGFYVDIYGFAHIYGGYFDYYYWHHYKILYSTSSPKIVVLVGDAAAHSAPSGTSIFGAGYEYGGDPGRDEVMFTPDDLDYGPVIDDVASKGIAVLAVDYSMVSTAYDNFEYIATNTGGAHFDGTISWAYDVASWIYWRTYFNWPKCDVAFIVDLSGSMSGSVLVDVKTQLKAVVDNLLYWGIDADFGLGTFVDYPQYYSSYGYSAQYGSPSNPDYAWYMDQDITADYTLVKSTIDGFVAIGGADSPQDYTRALFESQFFTWRAMARYEWGIVGRDAASIDSAGLSMVSAAFKEKYVEYGLAGADMYNPTPSLQMPSVMSKFGTGDTRNDYKDSKKRTALKDDYCTTWPISSSNMIGEGGPNANLLAYYGNDLTSAFFGLEDFTSYAPWKNKIVALSCWSRYAYASNATVGYAVVSTFLDLNGTVGFLVWGYDGRDTYYASKWFLEDGVFEFQQFPQHATSVILKIDYTTHSPTVSVKEVLGTISETLVEGIKGGIHPDP